MSTIPNPPKGNLILLRRSLPPLRRDDDDCNHGNSAPGVAHQTLGDLNYEFTTDVCRDCGACVVTNSQHDDFQAWLLDQSDEHFIVHGMELRRTTVATAERLAQHFRKNVQDVYRACALVLDSCVIPDEEWNWTRACDEKSSVLVAPLKLHPILFLRLSAWTGLAELTLPLMLSKTIDVGLRRFGEDGRFHRSIEMYLMT